MKDFYITFGVQYGSGKNQVLHPAFSWIESDGYIKITAQDELIARVYANKILAGNWAFMYDYAPLPMYAPLGELAHWTFGR